MKSCKEKTSSSRTCFSRITLVRWSQKVCLSLWKDLWEKLSIRRCRCKLTKSHLSQPPSRSILSRKKARPSLTSVLLRTNLPTSRTKRVSWSKLKSNLPTPFRSRTKSASSVLSLTYKPNLLSLKTTSFRSNLCLRTYKLKPNLLSLKTNLPTSFRSNLPNSRAKRVSMSVGRWLFLNLK